MNVPTSRTNHSPPPRTYRPQATAPDHREEGLTVPLRERLWTAVACWLASLSFSGPGQLLSGRPLRAAFWFVGELLLVAVWLLTAALGQAWHVLFVSGLLCLYHLAGWIDAARCGWHFRRIDLNSSLSRVLVMAGLVAVAPLPAAALIYGPGQKYLVAQYSVAESSMATTLLGRHADLQCRSCGYCFSAGFLDHQDNDQPPADLRCQMCGNRDFDEKPRPSISDRVMVSRRITPRRWDLLMFRSPTDKNALILKRLVGLPGEVLEIIDGDIFINGQMVSKDPLRHQEMWLPVADTEFWAATSHNPPLRWQPDESALAWKSRGRTWLFSPPADTEQSLELAGSLTDQMTYNAGTLQYIQPEPVHDIRLHVTAADFQGPGALTLVWERAQTQVQARFSRQGKLTLTVKNTEGIQKSSRSQKILQNSKLTLIIRDGYAYASADDREFCRVALGPLDSEDALKRQARAPRLRITAANSHGSVERIQVDREVHYRGLYASDSGKGLSVSHTKPFDIPPGHYYLLGDNSAVSTDSRLGWAVRTSLPARTGPSAVPAELSEGVVTWLYWPLARVHAFP